MASNFDYRMGYCYNVFGVREELCGIYGCQSFVGNYWGWIASWNGELSIWTRSASQADNPQKVLYLSGMYTRGEMALRLGLFYTAASLSGAFGGQY